MDEARVTQIQGVVESILAEHQVELVELTCHPQGGGFHVRLLVDQPGGVTLHQCAKMNQLVGEALERANLLEGSYTVEVSSPGLDRPLRSRRDFERALGEDVQVNVHAEPGRIRELRGMLLAVQLEAVVLKTSAGNITVPLAQVQGAKKVLRW